MKLKEYLEEQLGRETLQRDRIDLLPELLEAEQEEDSRAIANLRALLDHTSSPIREEDFIVLGELPERQIRQMISEFYSHQGYKVRNGEKGILYCERESSRIAVTYDITLQNTWITVLDPKKLTKSKTPTTIYN